VNQISLISESTKWEELEMSLDESRTGDLLSRAAEGDRAAANELLLRHNDRLKKMISVRIDPAVSARVDPSDVIQETMIEAVRKLPEYLANQPVPFYPWLRQIAWERLVHLHEQHIRTQKRSVRREVSWDRSLSDHSVMQLAGKFAGSGTTPSQGAIRTERRERVRAALNSMTPNDREVLVMLYLEQLGVDEIASILDLTVAGVKSRHRRALIRLTSSLAAESGGC